MRRRMRSKLSVRLSRRQPCGGSNSAECNHNNSNNNLRADNYRCSYRLQPTKRLVAQAELNNSNFNFNSYSNSNNATKPPTNSLFSAMKHASTSRRRKKALNFVTIGPTTAPIATGTACGSTTPRRLIITGVISVALPLLIVLSSSYSAPMVFAQSFGAVKGGSLSSSLFNQQQQQQQIAPAVPATTSGLSQTFVQMFNSLTPVQQQQFIRQMSSSNRRIFQQAIQAQPIANSFVEESSSSSSSGGNTGVPVSGSSVFSSTQNQNLGGSTGFSGTKSASFKQTQANQQVLSPVQSGFFRSQQSKSFASAPTIIQQPASSFSFSRQIQQSQQTPQIITTPTSSNEFKSTKTVFNTAVAQPQPQQQSSFFNRVVQQQQVAQPVVLPSSEQSFRRVQSFSSQPLVTPTEATSGFVSQQFSQQVQPQPVQQSFNKFQQSSFTQQQQQQQPQTVGFNQFSTSSSSNLAGGSGGFGSSFGSDGTGTGFSSAALQQEKLDATSGADLGVTNLQQVVGTGGLQQSNFESSSTSQSGGGGGVGGLVGGTNSLITTTGGFDSTDAQQKNIALPESELYGGLTAASINNKWYIMRPVENPTALGLGDARAASGSLRQVPLARALAATGGSSSSSSGATSSSARQVASSPSSTTTATSQASPKKRSPSNKRVAANEPIENEAEENSNGSSGDNDGEDSESTRK